MPTYEYACRSCDEHIDVVQSIGDDALTECPSCGGELRKVFGAVGVVFKGSGFYKTDSRSSSKASGSDRSDKADTKSGGTGTDSAGSGTKDSGSKDSGSKSSTSSTSTGTSAAAS